MQELLNFLGGFVDNSSDFVLLATLKGRPVHINEAGRKLIGLDPVVDVDADRHAQLLHRADLGQAQRPGFLGLKDIGRWEGEGQVKHLVNRRAHRRADHRHPCAVARKATSR